MSTEERVALAICRNVHPFSIHHRGEYQRASCPFCQHQLVKWGGHWETCGARNEAARAAIAEHKAALADDGLVIVPREPTEAMLAAEIPSSWRDTGENFTAAARTHIWQAMIDEVLK